jgi:transposase
LPVNQGTGSKSGKRFIGGGRGNVRPVLSMAALVGIRHNGVLNAYSTHFNSKGKVTKVAIVACMRKLLSSMNTIVRIDSLWKVVKQGGAA